MEGGAAGAAGGGHEVYALTLTGLGERSHLATPEIGLDTHVQDVHHVLEYEDLHDVVLLGHSYGGMVVTAVADRAVDRLARLIYLDAVLPHDGECSCDVLSSEVRASAEERARLGGDGWRIPLTPEADRRAVPMPLKPRQQPVRLTGPGGTVPVGVLQFRGQVSVRRRQPHPAGRRSRRVRYRALDAAADRPDRRADLLGARPPTLAGASAARPGRRNARPVALLRRLREAGTVTSDVVVRAHSLFAGPAPA